MGVKTMVEDLRVYVNAREGYEDTVVVYGRRALARQDNQGVGRANRVVVCPPPSRPGVFGGASRPGQPVGAGADASGQGRPAYTLEFPYEVHCWAYVTGEAEVEQTQDDAALLLAGVVIIGLRSGAQGGYGAGHPKNGGFGPKPVERALGSEFVFDWVIPLRLEDLTNPAVVPLHFPVTAEFGEDDDNTEDADFAVPAA